MNEKIYRALISFTIGLIISSILFAVKTKKTVALPPAEIDWPRIQHVTITTTNPDIRTIRFNVDIQYAP